MGVALGLLVSGQVFHNSPEPAFKDCFYHLEAYLRLQFEVPTSMESQFSVGTHIVPMYLSCCLHALNVTRSSKTAMQTEKNLLKPIRGPAIFSGTAM